ncbi:restriction endonuclease subunit S [Streptococcus thermophilus]|uniref:restriction endonuclease subunit S n=1 Tax=Streptococcus thermophilus TaxID=1308 RepID=UPI00263BC946|nr:restriction endonuclease subunit S [Streptococcus thermophilus]MCE2091771.1 restriction endonuclease subunit S [Streptococcus thermophilus]MCE2096669.1 restriction endonuclease subunit S [Streptococcus thermophilus]
MSSIRLGEIGKISMCKRILKSQTNEFSGIPFYKISTFGGTPTVYIDEKIYREYKEKYSYPKKGDILISAAGTIGKTVIFDGEDSYFQDSNIVWIENDESKVTNQFLYYFLQTNPFITTNGSTIKRLYNDNLRDTKIPNVPSIQQQNQITDILGTLDKKIQTNNQINQELEAMAKTLYDYWFVQFDFPDQNGKPYKSSGGKMVYNPELKREIPEGWGVESVGNLLDKVTKAEKIENNSIEFIGEIPVIDQSQKYIAGFTNNENAILQPQDGHVIFGDHTRVVKYINFDYARGADGTQVLISNNENISNVLLYHMIEDFDLSNYGYARHFKFLKEKTVIVPDKEVSSKFETQANVIYEKIKNNIFENQELTQLRDWLLPMLMNGQVKVE